ncbi:GGDEF domain-containing protein [Candidatus Symbiobacter mobilis]|uniref:diguanylate cyclase n=1 Tax=Candidatus Symbiobacter mobilis CR TaxID=946483 RepID=U5NEL2_9BURK|nr:diguanylate cyclase [Candidatus Symbiobacter mobilis]AGX88673.1 diguanylate cyclase [Candidatus Symbiobacter mobilis CR]
MTAKKPFEIARDTLKQLTVRKLPPTPTNYQRVYSEIAGLPIEPPFPLDRLRDIALSLPAKTPGQQKQKALLESAIGNLNWNGVKSALMAYGGFTPATSAPGSAPGEAETKPLVESKVAVTAASPSAGTYALTGEFFALIARLIEYTLPALTSDDERFLSQTQALIAALREPSPDPTSVKLSLANYTNRLSFAAEDQAEIKSMLLRLLHLIIDNIGQLSIDDSWLLGQVEALKTVCAPPLTLRRLDDLERRLKDVIFKQAQAKERATQVQEDMRRMLGAFVERLGAMSTSTGVFHSQMEENAKLIEQAKSLTDIAPVLKRVVSATRDIAHETLSARDELQGMRRKVEATEAELAKLHQELDRISAQARHDPLTGALNRQGLDEAINREVANLRRKEAPLSVSLLDIDNFKKLNDSLGHAAGDEALAHLASVAREVMRPQDTLARYGGEEFVILLPDTNLEQGIEAMTRLQRELTKRFFLAGTEKVLITFSAGVAQVAADEEVPEAIRRADQAMYLAKRAGKNRVCGA